MGGTDLPNVGLSCDILEKHVFCHAIGICRVLQVRGQRSVTRQEPTHSARCYNATNVQAMPRHSPED